MHRTSRSIPRALRDDAVAAEAAGFDAVMCSDHLARGPAQGHSGFTWTWLGAALQATDQVRWARSTPLASAITR